MITTLFTILSAMYDKGRRFTDHSIRFIFRFIVILLISYLEIGNILINFAVNTSLFYLMFDYILNILEGRKWNYVGVTSEIDKFWNKNGGWISQLIFKIFLVIIIIYLKWIMN